MPFLRPLRSSPRAIIFDLGRGIIPINLPKSFGSLDMKQYHSPQQVWDALVADPSWLESQRGRLLPRDWHRHVSEKFGLSLGYEEMCATWNGMLNPEIFLAASFFERLGRTVRLGLVSNTDPIHVAHIEATFPFVRHFPVRVYSCDVGSTKPDAAIYLHALGELGSGPEETLFVDDLHENVEAAVALGMEGFHFTSADEFLFEMSRSGILPD